MTMCPHQTRTGARVRDFSALAAHRHASIRWRGGPSAECGLRSWESDGGTDCAHMQRSHAGQALPPLAGMARLVRVESNRRSLVAATKQLFVGYRTGGGSMHKLMQ